MLHGNVVSGCFPDVLAELQRAEAQQGGSTGRAQTSEQKHPAPSASRPIPPEASRPPAATQPRMFLQNCG